MDLDGDFPLPEASAAVKLLWAKPSIYSNRHKNIRPIKEVFKIILSIMNAITEKSARELSLLKDD